LSSTKDFLAGRKTEQMSSHLQECFERVHSLQTLKQKLTDEAHYRLPKQLCEHTELFLPFIKALEEPDVFSQKVDEFPELSALLQSLATLFADIQDFVSPNEDESTFLKIACKMIVNTDIQTEMKDQIKSFQTRIQELEVSLLPGHNNSVAIDTMQVAMKAILDHVIKHMTDHSVDIEYLKEIVNALIANCSKQNTEVMSKLLELQNVLSSDVDYKTIYVNSALTALHSALQDSLKVDVSALHNISPILFLHCCYYNCDIPVELRMIICQYVMLKTELVHVSAYEGHINNVHALLLSESDNRLFSGSADKTIKVWNTISKTCIATLQGHSSDVLSLCCSSQRHRLFSGSWDMTIKVWDTETWQCLHTLEGHRRPVAYLVFDESVNRLYSSSDKTIKVWDLHTLTCVHTLQENGAVLASPLSFKSNGLYFGSMDNTIKVLNSTFHECVGTMEGHSSLVNRLCLSEDGSRLYSTSGDTTIKVWDTATNTCIATLEGHTWGMISLCLSSKANRLISASVDKTMRVWDLNANICVHTLTDSQSSAIRALAISDNGVTLYSAGGDIWSNNAFVIKVWQVRQRFV
jgi:WD40 repeat protein